MSQHEAFENLLETAFGDTLSQERRFCAALTLAAANRLFLIDLLEDGTTEDESNAKALVGLSQRLTHQQFAQVIKAMPAQTYWRLLSDPAVRALTKKLIEMGLLPTPAYQEERPASNA